jgi:L-threonylcarbamoyladenylate synthase
MTVPGPAQIEEAVRILRNGGVIAMPSDTLYALSAAASDADAVRRVFDVKGREGARALPLFVSDVAMAERIGVLDTGARRLAERFWPGPLTIVVPTKADYESEALAGGRTVALRVPDHELALAVIRGLGDAVTGTSANLTGGRDPDSPEEVRHQIGRNIDLILDAGPAAYGVASTIVDCTGPSARILRDGAVGREAVDETLADGPGGTCV